jgi:hypothetical protein
MDVLFHGLSKQLSTRFPGNDSVDLHSAGVGAEGDATAISTPHLRLRCCELHSALGQGAESRDVVRSAVIFAANQETTVNNDKLRLAAALG